MAAKRDLSAIVVLILLACSGPGRDESGVEQLPSDAESTLVESEVGSAPRAMAAEVVAPEPPPAAEPLPPIELPRPVFWLSAYKDSLDALAYAIGWPGAEHGTSERPPLPDRVELFYEGRCREPALEISAVLEAALPWEVEPRLPLYRLERAHIAFPKLYAVRHSLVFPAGQCRATSAEQIFAYGSPFRPAVEERAKDAALEQLGWSPQDATIEWNTGGAWLFEDGSQHFWIIYMAYVEYAEPRRYVVVGASVTSEGSIAIDFTHHLPLRPRERWRVIEPVDLDGDGELEFLFWTMEDDPQRDLRHGLAILKLDADGKYQLWRQVTLEDVTDTG